MRPWMLMLCMTLLAGKADAKALPFDGGPGASTPSLAADPSRGIVLTWQTRNGNEAQLNYALMDANGRELRRGVIASGSDWFVNWADFPSLAVLDTGDWVSFWLQKSAADTYAYDIRVVRSSNGGGRWTAPVTPHLDGTATEHGFVSMQPLSEGRVQMLWLDGRNSGSAGHGDDHASEGPMSLRSAVIDRRGRVLESQELDGRTCSCCQTDSAALGEEIHAVYRDRSKAEIRDISMVTRDAGGRWSRPRRLHKDNWQTSACPVNGPAIAASGEQLIVAWPTLAQPPLAVRYQVRKDDKVRAEAILEQSDAVLGRVDASAAADNGFAISWIGAGNGGSALKLAEVDAKGAIRNIRVIATLPPGHSTGNPRLLWYRDAHYLTWTESAGRGQTQVRLERVDR